MRIGYPRAAPFDGPYVDGLSAYDLEDISIRVDPRADIDRRWRMITRRRQIARLRSALRVFGWTAGVVALVALIISGTAGLLGLR